MESSSSTSKFQPFFFFLSFFSPPPLFISPCFIQRTSERVSNAKKTILSNLGTLHKGLCILANFYVLFFLFVFSFLNDGVLVSVHLCVCVCVCVCVQKPEGEKGAGVFSQEELNERMNERIGEGGGFFL